MLGLVPAAEWDRLLRIPPGHAAAVILRGVRRRRARVLIGASAWLPDVAVRLAPTAPERLVRMVGAVLERGSRPAPTGEGTA